VAPPKRRDGRGLTLTLLIVVQTPIFHFSAGIFKRHEPVGVQALCPELAVQALDESIIRRLAGPGEVERDPALIGPQVEIPGNELRALVDPDHPGQPDLAADTFEHIDNIGSPEGEPRLEGRREPRERIDDRQDPDLAPRGELVVHEVHRPRLVRLDRRTTILPQLRLHAPLGHLVAQLQAQLLVEPVDPLGVDDPALAPQQHVDAAIAVAHPRLGDLLDPLHESGLRAALALVVVGRRLRPQHAAGPTDRNLPGAADLIDQPAPARRPYSFRDRTS
jgi:hypothetical protein